MGLDFSKSELAFQQAKNSLVGGVNSPVRSFKSLGGSPCFFKRGVGCKVYDLNGNEFIDYVGSWGPNILGHAVPEVLEAIKETSQHGVGFGAPHLLETELAELVVSVVPSIEKIRMVNSGTEATMSAVRLARGYTKKNKIIKFSGCYHGHSDSFLIKAGSGLLTLGQPDSPGVPTSISEETLIATYNDLDSVVQLFEKYGRDIAGVIVEPIAGNMGVVPSSQEFIDFLRKITGQHGALLIFDEVMSGFRVGLAGAQSLYGCEPDLTCFGKVIGGGLPVGAYGGKKEVMSCLSPEGLVYQAGTLSGNPVSMAAGLAVLKQLADSSKGIYAQLEEKATYFEKGVKVIQEKVKDRLPTVYNRVGSMATLFFSSRSVVDFATATESNTELFAKYFHGLLQRGVYIGPSAFEAGFISTAHEIEDLDKTLTVMEEVLTGLQN